MLARCRRYWPRIDPKGAKLNNLNYHPPGIVSRYRDPRFQVTEKYAYLFNLRLNIYKAWCLIAHSVSNKSDLTARHNFKWLKILISHMKSYPADHHYVVYNPADHHYVVYNPADHHYVVYNPADHHYVVYNPADHHYVVYNPADHHYVVYNPADHHYVVYNPADHHYVVYNPADHHYVVYNPADHHYVVYNPADHHYVVFNLVY